VTPTALALPPSLRVFLDAGCDLGDLLGPERLEGLAEQAVEAPRLFPAEQLAHSAGMWRSILDEWLASPDEALKYSDDPQLDVTALAWRIELLEHPELAKRVEAALPPELVEAAIERVDCERRPFRLDVEQLRTFTCVVCGEAYERTRVVRLAPRSPDWPDVGELPELTFCPECISAAAVASRARSLSAVPPADRLPKLSTALERVGFVRQKLMEQGFAEKSIKAYVSELRRAEFWCEDQGYTLRNVPDAEFARFVATRPRTEPTRKQLRSAVGHYWRIIPRRNPPLWLVRVPKKRRGVCRTLEEEEARAMVAVALKVGGKRGLAVLLAMYLALRREEIAMLRWDAFTKDGWVLIVGKGEQEAKLPVHPVLLDALARLEREDPTWVFTGRKPGTHIGVVSIWQWIVALGREAGIEDLTPHRLRHTALATANDRSKDMRAVQDFARHAKIDTTSMYTRSTARRLVEVMRSIDYGEGPPSVEVIRPINHGDVSTEAQNDPEPEE